MEEFAHGCDTVHFWYYLSFLRKGVATATRRGENPKVLELFNSITNEYNKSLSKEEQVKRFRIVQEEWTPETGELSPTLKLKRRVLNEKYAGLICEIFGKGDKS